MYSWKVTCELCGSSNPRLMTGTQGDSCFFVTLNMQQVNCLLMSRLITLWQWVVFPVNRVSVYEVLTKLFSLWHEHSAAIGLMFSLLLLSEDVVHVTQWGSLSHRVTTNKGCCRQPNQQHKPYGVSKSLTTLFNRVYRSASWTPRGGWTLAFFWSSSRSKYRVEPPAKYVFLPTPS